MRTLVFAALAGLATFIGIWAVLLIVIGSPIGLWVYLCPLLAAVVADIVHCQCSRALHPQHLAVVVVPTLLVVVISAVFALAVGPSWFTLFNQLAAVAISAVVAGIGFVLSWQIRTNVFSYGYDIDQAEPVSYRLAE